MESTNATPSPDSGCHILATDLDGTLIPLDGDPQNLADLKTLAGELEREGTTLIFSTGRHFTSVAEAIGRFQLPQPDWLICDVGTSIYRRRRVGTFEIVESYQEHQDRIIKAMPIHVLRDQLEPIKGLRRQEQEKQGRFKLSFYVDSARLDELVGRVQEILEETDAPYSLIHSVDPFNGDGLIDLLPSTVSKAHALQWWVRHTGSNRDALVCAGDSGNDLAALTAGYRAILVANADRSVAKKAHEVHRESGWKNRLYLARERATSGVLEGCRWFGLGARMSWPTERLGATPVTYDQTHFRVWAPERQSVAVDLTTGDSKSRYGLTRDENGYFTGVVPEAPPGSQYCYILDSGDARPDPASRYQPDGVHGPSQIIDPQSFPWSDQSWPGVPKRDLIIYELHVGTFTNDGTFLVAIQRLPELLDLGVTAIEIMPVAQSPGRWNWGYDGVNLFAVRNTYGHPDDFKAFVDACHAIGIAVILDVVYNHLGPEGNYLGEFGPYFSSKHRTPWGEAFNFDATKSEQVRRFVLENAVFWLSEYHLDGLRLDAVHFIEDDKTPTILDEIRRAVSDYSESIDRTLHLIAESNTYDDDLLRCDEGSSAYDAIWCDCLMHSIYSHALPDLQLTHREYRGATDLAAALQYGYVYAGRPPQLVSARQREEHRYGEQSRRHIASFVTALQTHDSVGNHPRGYRLHQLTSRAFQRAAAGLVLLYPGIPLLFMGEEFASESQFPFFADFEDVRLRNAVDKGRAEEYPQHDYQDSPLPSDPAAFYQAKCPGTNGRDMEMFYWYRELIAFRKQGIGEGWLSASGMTSGYDVGRQIFSLRFACEHGGTILIQARLTGPQWPESAPVKVQLEGNVLLNSEPNLETCEDQILLTPNHLVVSGS